MVYYCVVTSVDNRGRVCAGIVDMVESDRKPDATFTGTALKDIYTDWFDNLDDAKDFVEQSMHA